MKMLNLSFGLLLLAGTALAADDLETTFQSLQSAETSNDTAQIKKLAVSACAMAHDIIVAPEPESSVDKAVWPARVEYAKSVQEHAEYALYVAALKAPPADGVDLFTTLEQVNSKSKYLDQGYGTYLSDVNQSGGAAKAAALAEKALTNFPNNEDLLDAVMESALTKRQNDRALVYAKKLIVVSEGTKHAAFINRGHFIAGYVEAQKNLFADADKDLRAALPSLHTGDASYAIALFYLGLSDYQLGKETQNRALIQQALKYSEDCSKISGPYSQQAYTNALLMKKELAR
jgi:tetratricopeptide (TPR) repeat protein